MDTLNRHKRTHKDSVLHSFSKLSAQLDEEGVPGASVPSVSQATEMWNWQQESNHDNLHVSGAVERTPADNDLVPVPFQYPNLGQNHPLTFDDSEDILQYLFPSPVAWSMPETPDPGAHHLGLTSQEITRGIVRDVYPRQMEEASPQALLQLNNLIHDAVSSQQRMSLFCPSVR